MAKKVRFESFVFLFLVELDRIVTSLTDAERAPVERMRESLAFRHEGGRMVVDWRAPVAGSLALDLRAARLFVRGDVTEAEAVATPSKAVVAREGLVGESPTAYFRRAAMDAVRRSGSGP